MKYKKFTADNDLAWANNHKQSWVTIEYIIKCASIGKSWLLFFRSRINQKRFYLFEFVYRKYISPAIELIIW